MFSQKEKDHILHVKTKIESLGKTWGVYPNGNTIIAGGVFYALFRETYYNDIDLFTLNGCITLSALDTNIQKNSEYLRKNTPQIVSVHREDYLNTIITNYKTREELIADFDYVHCCVSYDFEKLWISKDAYDAIMRGKLIVNNASRVSEYRRSKFLKRGLFE
jgi:hypothetical protein